MKWMVWMMLQPSATYPQPNKKRSTWEEVNLLNLLGDPTGNRTPVSGVRDPINKRFSSECSSRNVQTIHHVFPKNQINERM